MGLLDDIVARKRIDVAARREAVSRGALTTRAAALAPPRSLAAALTPRAAGAERIRAELTRASPVKGVLADGFDPVARAPDYVRAGAAALSVHTDPHCQGELEDH